MDNTQEPATQPKPSASWTGKLFRFLVVALVLATSATIFALREYFADLAVVGYPGIFLVSFLGNATVILPAPSLALVFAMGGILNPLLVGLVAGPAEALGELTGYLAGYSGRAVVENRRIYDRLSRWMQHNGALTVFILSLVPNPFFDLAGIAAGVLHYPLLRFLLFCWLGKSIKTIVFAFAGAYSLVFFKRFL